MSKTGIFMTAVAAMLLLAALIIILISHFSAQKGTNGRDATLVEAVVYGENHTGAAQR
ncbi:MAG: hypothetical protein ACYCX2_11510 [Christensenellales bacterium]